MTDPALDRMTEVVRILVDLMQPFTLPAVDFADEREILKEGGQAAYGRGQASGPSSPDRARLALMRAVEDLTRNGWAIRKKPD